MKHTLHVHETKTRGRDYIEDSVYIRPRWLLVLCPTHVHSRRQTLWWTKSTFSWACYQNVIQWSRDRGTGTCSHSFHTLYWWLVSSALTVVCTLLVPRGESGESLPVLPEVPIRRPETQQENTDIHNTPWTHRLLIVRTNVLHKDKVKCPLTRQGTSEVHSQTKFVLSLQLITCKEWYRLRLASCQGVV